MLQGIGEVTQHYPTSEPLKIYCQHEQHPETQVGTYKKVVQGPYGHNFLQIPMI